MPMPVIPSPCRLTPVPEALRLFALSVLLFCLFLSPCLAAGAADMDSARASFEAGRFDEAYEQFDRIFRDNPGAPEVNFWLGRAAFQAGDYETAVMAFERVLITRPRASRVKLEMARSHYRLGNLAQARNYFEEVLAAEPPTTVRDNIRSFLARIHEKQQRHLFGGMFSVALSYDDNARSAPVEETVKTVLGDVTLTGDGAGEKNDLITQSTLVLNHAYRGRGDHFAWRSNLINYNAFYADEGDLDLNFLAGATGPVWNNDVWQFGLSATAHHLDVDNDGFLRSYGVDMVASRSFSPRLVWILELRAERKDYLEDEGRDARNLRAHLGPQWEKGPYRFELKAGAETEEAEDDENSYDRLEIFAAGKRRLPWKLQLGLSFRYKDSDYEEAPALFAERRRDDTREYGLTLSRLLWRDRGGTSALLAQVNHTYTNAGSNIDLFHYEKNVTTATLSYNF